MTVSTSILDTILANTRVELAARQQAEPLEQLAERAASAPPVRSFAAALRAPGRVTLIAEVKKASPSRGVLLPNFDHRALAALYAANGAAAISVLTDERFFQGSLRYLAEIRADQDSRADAVFAADRTGEAFAAERRRTGEAVAAEDLFAAQDSARANASPQRDHDSANASPQRDHDAANASPQRSIDTAPPLLRKDFIVDPYQVYEARASGADALLLIVAALTDVELRDLLALTAQLCMDALVEVHDETEMARALAAGARIIGVNNRDLHTFTTTLTTTERLAHMLPASNRPILVSESGIFSAADVQRLQGCGVDAVLVGEALVTAPEIGPAVRALAGHR